MKNKSGKSRQNPAAARKWGDPETIIAFVAILVLGGLIAMGLNGPLKGGLLTVVGYFFGRPLIQSVFK